MIPGIFQVGTLSGILGFSDKSEYSTQSRNVRIPIDQVLEIYVFPSGSCIIALKIFLIHS